MIQANDISVEYGNLPALQHVSVTIRPGEFISIFGKNGAGKTTFFKALTSLVRLRGGEVIGIDPKTIGYIAHASWLYPKLTARENLEFYAGLYGLKKSHDRIGRLLSDFGLTERADEPVIHFSRGMAQRLSIARALLHEPKILLMDEPYSGLDTDSRRFLDDWLRHYHQNGGCVAMITHEPKRLHPSCDRVIVFDRGTIVFDGIVSGRGFKEHLKYYHE